MGVDVVGGQSLEVSRLLVPGPCWALGGVVLGDGRVLLADTFRGEVWEYSAEGSGRRLEWASDSRKSPKMIQGAPGGGALWLFTDGQLVELDPEDADFRPRRSYAVWGRRDGAGRLLESLHQWTLAGDETVVGLSFTKREVWVVRLELTAGQAGRFEVLESVARMRDAERRYLSAGAYKLAALADSVYMLRLREEVAVVQRVGSGEILASYPGGGDGVTDPSALGLVTVGEEVWVLRRRGERFWLQDLSGLRLSRPRASEAFQMAPVVGKDRVGLLELLGPPVPEVRGSAVLWVSESGRSRAADGGGG